ARRGRPADVHRDATRVTAVRKEQTMRTRLVLAGLAAAALALLPVAFAGSGTTFGAPVKVTPAGGHGYEPAVYTDHYGNIFATAHKENWQLALAPDLNSPTFTRSMSWARASSHGGPRLAGPPGP